MSRSNAPGPIEHSPDRRRLVAVMYADMVGYSRLIGLDDAGTLHRLRALRSDLIDPAIEQHGGRIVQTGGDSLLVVFDSIDGAVRCAVKVQRELPVRDSEQPPDRVIRFRIGMSIGDAIADGTDLHGDAVNVAARLQVECPAGGICVSRSVRDHVHGRLDLAFEDLGALNLKNIARPVEAFLVKPVTETLAKSIERTLVHGTGEALPLPDKPSIAVLAFTNMSGDPEQEYFSEGIADDIITELSRSRSLFVVARNSSFTYKGRAVDIKQVARELGVRYVLEGSVRRSGDRVRVVAQLIDAETGNHIWAERYDRAVEDVFAVQDEITRAVVTAIIPAVADAELGRILRKPPESLGAWEAYQRGLWHLARASLEDSERARELFRYAITIDARFAPAYAALATAILESAFTYGTPSWEETSREATDWARRAVALDHQDAEAQAALGGCMYLAGKRAEGGERIDLALVLDPNSSGASFQKGATLMSDGRPVEGRDFILKAMRLDPRGPQPAKYLSALAGTYYFERAYESAIEVARRSIVRYPAYPRAHRWLAAALGQLGRVDEARGALEELTRLSSSALPFFISSQRFWQDQEHLLDGLRKAGWQG